MILSKTTWFEDVPADCTVETWVELTAGSVQCNFVFSNLDPGTLDRRWGNPVLLRTPQKPNNAGRAPLSGPVAAVLFAEVVVTSNGTEGLVAIRVLDATGAPIRRQVWDLHNGNAALRNGDALNGIHTIYLA